VPHQDLDHADIDILFQQMDGKLWRSVWGDTRFLIPAASAASWMARLSAGLR